MKSRIFKAIIVILNLLFIVHFVCVKVSFSRQLRNGCFSFEGTDKNISEKGQWEIKLQGNDKNRINVVAKIGKKVIGYAYLISSEMSPTGKANFYLKIDDPHYYGTRVGDDLFDVLIKEAATRGITFVKTVLL